MRRRGEGNRSRARERAAETGKVWFGNDVDEETKSKASIRGSTDRTRATDAGPTETRPRSARKAQPAGSEGLRHDVPPCWRARGFHLAHEGLNLELDRDDFSSKRHPALAYCRSTIFPENRYPPRIKSGAGFFGIMLWAEPGPS
jgi:hypothetical protein